ncbi:MAG TPA: hypothetical protein VGO57_17630 [Verrucomicrobiae bacterium]|jgi:hypothetical protein
MKTILPKLGLFAATVGLLTAGCVVYPDDGVDVYSDPPPLIVETIPPDPGGGVVWVGGEWAWHDHWVWEKGHYDRPPHPGARWVPHQYVHHGGRRTYIHGRWQ